MASAQFAARTMTRTTPGRRRFDVGLVVPLNEELRYVISVASIVETITFDGSFYYILDFQGLSVVCCLIGNMGPLPALHATTRLLNLADVRLLVVLGLAGALDSDISVGDVVVASEVNEFQANSKAETSSDESFELRYSGRHFPLDFRIRESIGHFEFSGHIPFGEWQKDTQSHLAEVNAPHKDTICTAPAKLHIGPVASGNTVAASAAFVEELKRIDRKFIGIDMEAAGVALAATDRIHPIPCIVIRGISDPANESKAKLEKEAKGAWRGYCVRNATAFLRRLLEWEGFRIASGLSATLDTTDPFAVTKELAARLTPRVGGAWLVAVMFDIYTHAPLQQDNIRVVPADIARARLSDSSLALLLDEVLTIKEGIDLGKLDIDAAEERLTTALEGYRTKNARVEIGALLSTFDKVAGELIFPNSDDDEARQQLLAADEIEEREGVDALISFLRAAKPHTPQVRERYIDALDRASMWPEIVEAQEGVDPSNMGRAELEHCIYACARVKLEERAMQLFEFHRKAFADAGAGLFRTQAMQQFASLRPRTTQSES